MARSDWRRPTSFPIPEECRRIRITVSYDGADFNGWQRQKSARSVQDELEKALEKMLKVRVVVHGSGRTDSGVHAIGQVAHFDIANKSVPPQAFSPALNQLLPHDIRVREAMEVDGTFHSRFTSTAREYRYYTKEEKFFTPFDRNHAYKIRRFPPLDLLNGYAACLVGTHDFSTFSAVGDQSHSRIRDIFVSYFLFEPAQWGGMQLVYVVRGNAFLWHQVRSMAGTMLHMGLKGEPVEAFQRRFEARDRLQAGKTAPAGGLYLYRIDYDE